MQRGGYNNQDSFKFNTDNTHVTSMQKTFVQKEITKSWSAVPIIQSLAHKKNLIEQSKRKSWQKTKKRNFLVSHSSDSSSWVVRAFAGGVNIEGFEARKLFVVAFKKTLNGGSVLTLEVGKEPTNVLTSFLGRDRARHTR